MDKSTADKRDEQGDSLDEGRCRFNCQTRKENWIAGFEWALGEAGYTPGPPEEEWREWKRQHPETG